jgi:hypothetical protein
MYVCHSMPCQQFLYTLWTFKKGDDEEGKKGRKFKIAQEAGSGIERAPERGAGFEQAELQKPQRT